MSKRTSGQRNGFSTPNIKNREVFKKIKTLNQIRPKHDGGIGNVESSEIPYFSYKRPSLILKFLTILTIVFLFIMGNVITNMAYCGLKDFNKKSIESYKKELAENERRAHEEIAYQIQFHNTQGNYHLEKLNINAAKDHFERVLKIDAHNQEALLGMAKTLSVHCELKDRFCKEAEEYWEYINQHDLVQN
jgi:hypothetical protein